ncbi:MAG: helix-turn-helix transcriptional regulator [Gemmatimonadaceae bacterium]|nr:helix-turn-helix transcriptional regulator [Gemmatimonadaceae bacterium]NUQ93209.1 helix-turn-helix transcriptional regulator [Gemmatimonadaceae bacterium]NUR18967.1 helix-turn-helix transcriptional regulator [Gemmatimonadaceae bacterium]NUS96209.1 helix-turn-helix transcriptional regulator [Gemmatimonadaceae bacterium]
MAKTRMAPELVALVAVRFRALAEPARLEIMQTLRGGECTVGELADATGLGVANVSKHLQSLHGAGFVTRRKEGLHVYYALAGDDVFALCDIICGRLASEVKTRGRIVASR